MKRHVQVCDHCGNSGEHQEVEELQVWCIAMELCCVCKDILQSELNAFKRVSAIYANVHLGDGKIRSLSL